MKILGIFGLYHDSAAAIIEDGEIIAAAQEERFTRKKHDKSVPYNAIDYCLNEGNSHMWDLDAVVFYDQPMLTLDRYIQNVLSLGQESAYEIENYFDDVVVSRLSIDRVLRKKYTRLGKEDKLHVLEHHLSHAASAFYPSPFEEAAILTIYPHSLGLLYSAFTAFCGFKVNSGDYKFMGLAPYGEPIFYDVIKDKLFDVKEDGSFRLNLEYFDYYCGKYMTNQRFSDLFGGSATRRRSHNQKRDGYNRIRTKSNRGSHTQACKACA